MYSRGRDDGDVTRNLPVVFSLRPAVGRGYSSTTPPTTVPSSRMFGGVGSFAQWRRDFGDRPQGQELHRVIVSPPALTARRFRYDEYSEIAEVSGIAAGYVPPRRPTHSFAQHEHNN